MTLSDDLARFPVTPERTYEGRRLPHPDEPVYDQGLAFDVDTLLGRRKMLKIIGFTGLTAGLATLAACGPGASALPSLGATSTPGSTSSSTTAAGSAGTGAARAVIPEETAGPFPGDGTNGPNALATSGVVRSDIRSSFGTSSTVAAGVPLTIKFAVLNAKNSAPLAGSAIYVWHCDRDGQYSMYGHGVENENYLRGVQAADANGIVTFQSVFPACYQGRWPHVHFEVYESLAKAGSAANKLATSQIALPRDACASVYATDGYAASQDRLAQVSLERDMVFSDDGGVNELGRVSGSVSGGLAVSLDVPVAKR